MSRRRFLLGALAGLGLPAFGQDAPLPLLGGRLRADPDLDRLRADRPEVIGVRPHRLGGVRVELERVAGKRLVHDYGHGGAGITLAWGCAAEVVSLLEGEGEEQPVAVVGTGIAGLTVASEVQRRWPGRRLTVYARDLELSSTTSWLAGGQFEPSGIWREHASPEARARLQGWLRRAHGRLTGLDSARYGILPRDQFTLEKPNDALDEVTPPEVVPPFERGALPFARLSAPGRRYRTLLVNPTLHLPALKEDLLAAGVRFERRAFVGRDELLALAEPVVVNCTGYGAKALLGDDALVGQRGHLVVLDRTEEGQDWFFAGGCGNPVVAYVFCRQTDVVVGGTVIGGDDDPARRPSDDAVFDRLLANAGALFAGQVDRCAR